MISTIIRIIVTLTWLELNLLIWLGIRRGVGFLREIRDEARTAHDKANVAEGKADEARNSANLAEEMALTQLRVGNGLRNGRRLEE